MKKDGIVLIPESIKPFTPDFVCPWIKAMAVVVCVGGEDEDLFLLLLFPFFYFLFFLFSDNNLASFFFFLSLLGFLETMLLSIYFLI